MKKRSGYFWFNALLLATITALITIGVLVASDSGPSTSGLKSDRLTQMGHSGEMAKMLARHQAMMGQMRAGISPQMQQLMDADPMWKLMRTGEFAAMMEDQQRQIDRILGQGRP